ncbi:MAG TPA: oligosaccharide flippase family protein [Anaeromyxobacter sp.]
MLLLGLRNRFGERAGAAVRQGLTTVLDQGIVSVTNFATAIIIARGASKDALGLYSLGFGILLLATSVQSALVSVPYNVYCMRVPEGERARYSGDVLLHQVALSLLVAAAGAAAGYVLGTIRRGDELATVLVIVAVVAPLALAREFGRQMFFSRLRFTSALLLDVAVAVVQLGGLLLLWRRGVLSARTAYAITGVAAAVAALLWAVRARPLLAVRPGKETLSSFRKNWATGSWSLGASVLSVVAAQMYPWFIATSRGLGEVGTFAACTGIVAMTNPILIGMGNALSPRITHAFSAGGIAAVQRMTRIALAVFLAVMLVMCPLLFLLGGELLGHLYGPSFASQGVTVGLLSVALVADWLSLPAHYALLVTDRAHVMLKANVLVVVVNATVGFALVTIFSAPGAALGLLAGNALATAFKWREYRRTVVAVTSGEREAARTSWGTG